MGEIRDESPPTLWQQGAALPWPASVVRAIALVRGPVGPYVTAVVFALVALPVVLVDIEVYAKQYTDYRDIRFAPTDPSVLTASLLALLLAGIVGSIAGVPFARRRARTGWLVAVLVAWVTGIVALPIGPTIAGLPYAAARSCFDGCRASIVAPGIGIDSAKPELWIFGVWVSPIWAPWTLAALVIGAGIWAWLVNQAARPLPVASP